MIAKELAPVELIVPSLDGSNEEEFQKLNRPAPGLSIEKIARGIADFRTISNAQMWLELFIAEGINDSVESAERFRRMVEMIRPDKVQLNTLDRPGTERSVGIPSAEKLQAMAEIIRRAAPVELIGGRAARKSEPEQLSTEEYNRKIIATVASRPCTAKDLAVALGFNEANLIANLRRMEKAGLISSESGPRGIYYRAEKKS